MKITMETARSIYNQTGEVPAHIALLAILNTLDIPRGEEEMESFAYKGITRALSEMIKFEIQENPWLNLSYAEVERAILQNCKLASDSFPSSKF